MNMFVPQSLVSDTTLIQHSKGKSTSEEKEEKMKKMLEIDYIKLETSEKGSPGKLAGARPRKRLRYNVVDWSIGEGGR